LFEFGNNIKLLYGTELNIEVY